MRLQIRNATDSASISCCVWLMVARPAGSAACLDPDAPETGAPTRAPAWQTAQPIRPALTGFSEPVTDWLFQAAKRIIEGAQAKIREYESELLKRNALRKSNEIRV